MGLLDDLQASHAYEELRRHYQKLIPAKPLVLAEDVKSKEQKRALFYTGPFKPEMTHREARLIMGVTETYVLFLLRVSLQIGSCCTEGAPLQVLTLNFDVHCLCVCAWYANV